MEPPDDSDLFYLDNCAVCGQSGSKACGACELEYYCSKEHQKEDWSRHKQNCCKYEIKNHEQHGYCMVAKKVISPGELIAAEYPLTIYNPLRLHATGLQQILSLSGATAYPCPACDARKVFRGKCYRCSKCGLPLCSKVCENSKTHSEVECRAFQKAGIKVLETEPVQDVFTDLAIVRVFLKEENKGSPISFESPKWNNLLKMIFAEKLQEDDKNANENHPVNEDIIASLDAVEHLPLSLKIIGNQELVILLHCALTVYGVSSGNYKDSRKFLFTKNHRLSHSCLPNCTLWIEGDDKNNKSIIKATRLIQPGQRITINKGEKFVSLPTTERRRHLRQSLGLSCKCPRCKDPTELGLFLSAIRCEENLTASGCSGNYISTDPLTENAKWKCSSKSCKSSKTYQQIQSMLISVEEELPSVNGKADEILKQLNNFDEYYNGDVLCSSHYLIRVARSRMRQVIKYFLDWGEKLLLCVVNDFPRAYEYCTILLKSIDSLLFFSEKVTPNFNEVRGQLLYEKATANFAVALHEYLVFRKLVTAALVLKLENTLTTLKGAASAISIFTTPAANSLRDDINFMGSVIKKILGAQNLHLKTKNKNLPTAEIDNILSRLFSSWKSRSREIGLAAIYMEPSSKVNPISKDVLREIITSW